MYLKNTDCQKEKIYLLFVGRLENQPNKQTRSLYEITIIIYNFNSTFYFVGVL